MRNRCSSLIFLLSLSLVSAANAVAAGDLILIGGGTRVPEIIKRIGHAAGGENAKIVIAPWATTQPKESLELLRTQFATFNPKSVTSAPFFPDDYDPENGKLCKAALAFHQPIELFDAAAKRKFIEELRTATTLYFTGGSQNRILKVYEEDREIATAIREFRERGGLYVGTSAGTAAVPKMMMTGKLVELANGTDMAVVANGLGFLPPGVFVDQHFIQRGRFNRLRNLVLQDRSYIGIGISEKTAAIIGEGGRLEVIGDSQVVLYFYDLSDPTGPLTEVWLSRGAHFDLNTRTLIKPSAIKLKR